MKYVLVTGGVVSGLGKGVTASSIGAVLQACGLRVTSIKIDPYINSDAGTMSPFEHGEVYVLDDGGEVDLDLGNYERFLNISLTRDNNITTGKIFQHVIAKEREGAYLGKTVQVVPHITDAVQEWIKRVASIPVDGKEGPADVCVIELGGTVGDIESSHFVEALRQLEFDVGPGNFCHVHVSLVPVISVVGEQKTKPTQHSVRELRAAGLVPHLLACRSTNPLEQPTKDKLSQFCHVPASHIINIHDVPNIWHIPALLQDQKAHLAILQQFNLTGVPHPQLYEWRERAELCDKLTVPVEIAIIGKYTGLSDAYLSVIKALLHAGVACSRKMVIKWVIATDLEEGTKERDPEAYASAWETLKAVDGILVPGGFGYRGVEGKILAAKYARETSTPYLGICLGMQVAVIECARSLLGLATANSTEFVVDTKSPCVISMPEHSTTHLGGTMRLGARRTYIQIQDSLISRLYKKQLKYDEVKQQEYVDERHRHRYEVNPAMVDDLENAGLQFVGKDESGQRMEIVELAKHPFYVGVQFHPEFNSRPCNPSAPFLGLVAAASKQLEKFCHCWSLTNGLHSVERLPKEDRVVFPPQVQVFENGDTYQNGGVKIIYQNGYVKSPYLNEHGSENSCTDVRKPCRNGNSNSVSQKDFLKHGQAGIDSNNGCGDGRENHLNHGFPEEHRDYRHNRSKLQPKARVMEYEQCRAEHFKEIEVELDGTGSKQNSRLWEEDLVLVEGSAQGNEPSKEVAEVIDKHGVSAKWTSSTTEKGPGKSDSAIKMNGHSAGNGHCRENGLVKEHGQSCLFNSISTGNGHDLESGHAHVEGGSVNGYAEVIVLSEGNRQAARSGLMKGNVQDVHSLKGIGDGYGEETRHFGESRRFGENGHIREKKHTRRNGQLDGNGYGKLNGHCMGNGHARESGPVEKGLADVDGLCRTDVHTRGCLKQPSNTRKSSVEAVSRQVPGREVASADHARDLSSCNCHEEPTSSWQAGPNGTNEASPNNYLGLEGAASHASHSSEPPNPSGGFQGPVPSEKGEMGEVGDIHRGGHQQPKDIHPSGHDREVVTNGHGWDYQAGGDSQDYSRKREAIQPRQRKESVPHCAPVLHYGNLTSAVPARDGLHGNGRDSTKSSGSNRESTADILLQTMWDETKKKSRAKEFQNGHGEVTQNGRSKELHVKEVVHLPMNQPQVVI